MTSLVSIIIPCYNAGSYISQALESVGNQTFTQWELIAVDDAGAKDGTEERIKEFAQRHPSKRVKFIKHDKNQGVSGARNTAIKKAKGNLIALLDPDDVWMPHHLGAGVSCFEQDKDLAFYSSFAYVFFEDTNEVSGIEGYTDWELRAFPSILSIRNAIPNSSAILSKSVFDTCGMYDETIHVGEDCDLWIRIVSHNLKSHIHSEPTMYYRKHPHSATTLTKGSSQLKYPFAFKNKEWLELNLRQALDAQLRHIFSLNKKIERLKLTNDKLEERLLGVETSINNLKALPGLKQLLQFKKYFFRS